jgi:hypothetical protein
VIESVSLEGLKKPTAWNLLARTIVLV